jgi:hypothetical protein
MLPINPDHEKSLKDFYQEWKSCYTPRNPVKPPSIVSMRILFQYYTDGSIPGDFIAAILQNDLYTAFNSAPQTENEKGEIISEIELLDGTIQYLTVRFPIECYGSPDKFGKWINKMKKESNGKKTKLY